MRDHVSCGTCFSLGERQEEIYPEDGSGGVGWVESSRPTTAGTDAARRPSRWVSKTRPTLHTTIPAGKVFSARRLLTFLAIVRRGGPSPLKVFSSLCHSLHGTIDV